jgi:hypothetical protein
MLDGALRPTKDRLLGPLVRGWIGRIPPLAVDARCARPPPSQRASPPGRALRRCRGRALVAQPPRRRARRCRRPPSWAPRAIRGGLLDIVADTIGYAAIPLGIAAGIDTRTAWIIVAVLLATFYVNAVSWTYLAALLEKRAVGAAATGASTSTVMPRGFVEGTETIVFFTVALAWPGAAIVVLAIMAGAVGLTVAERLWWARGRLT